MSMLEQRIQQQFFDSADLKYAAAEVLSKPIADAVSALVGCITAGGKVDAPVPQRVFWAIFEGLVAIVLLLVGLHLLGILPLPWERGLSLPRYQGKAAALLLGLIFGIALGPCTFAYLAPVLGVIFGVARTQPGFAVLLLLAYGIGHCALIVAAGVSAEKVQQVLDWHGSSRGSAWLRRGCGLLVLAGAAWLAVTARG